jgi:hypothetical protein
MYTTVYWYMHKLILEGSPLVSQTVWNKRESQGQLTSSPVGILKDIPTISAFCCTYLKLVIFIDMHTHMAHACTYMYL